MTAKTKRGPFLLLSSTLLLLLPLIGLCLVFILTAQHRRATRAAAHPGLRTRRTPIRFHRSTKPVTGTPETRQAPVLLQADATHDGSEDADTLRLLCDKLVAATGVIPPDVAQKRDDSVGKAATTHASLESSDWFLWARLGSRPIPCSAEGSDAPGLRTYAVHAEEGCTFCLINGSDHKILYRLQLHLPRGVYKVEKLLLTPPTGELSRVVTLESPTTPYTARLVGLQGVDQASEGGVVKPGALLPDQICLLRFTEEAHMARVALGNARLSLHEMAASNPGPAKRLRRILDEGAAYVTGVTAGSSSTRAKRLGCIHRLILLNAQAESLHRNYQERHTVNNDRGAAVMGALEQMADALAETSAVLSGLVPQIECEILPVSNSPVSRRPGIMNRPDVPKREADGDGSAPNALPGARPGGDGPAQISDPSHEVRVTLSLANTGGHSVESVKLGMDVSALPEGVTCDPEDPAFFGTLRPGQTVRAAFRLRFPTLQALPAGRCVGDASYFTSGAPAHLRLRPW